MDRRAFLRWSAAATALALGGIALSWDGITQLSWIWDDEPAQGFAILSDEETKIVRALAGAIFPGDAKMPSGETCELDVFMDSYLAAIPRETAGLLRLLLRSINNMAMLDLGGRLHTRRLDERIALVKAWDMSSLGLRRSIFQSVKVILGMGYFERPEVLAAAGIAYECGGMG